VVADPQDYRLILEEMKATGGKVSEKTNFSLAVKAFQLTARYDAAISNYLGGIRPDGARKDFPDALTFQLVKALDLRYGENPHQKASFYKERDATPSTIANARQLQGKELSYNNIMDSDAAWQMACDFDRPAAVIVKHANPCGAATSTGDILTAYKKALQTDPLSAFGGIVAFNKPVDGQTAEELAKTFLEVIIAPGFDREALEVLRAKKNLRLLDVTPGMERVSRGTTSGEWWEGFSSRSAT